MSVLSEGNVAILTESSAIFEKVAMSSETVRNPRDNFYNKIEQQNMFVENPLYRNEFQIGNDIVVSDGFDNLFPYHWKMLVEQDSIMPGMMRQKLDLLLSGGLKLFQFVKNGNKVIEDEVIDTQISDWLDEQHIDDYLIAQAMDWVYLERNASLMVPNVASSIALFKDVAAIHKVERIPVQDVRMCRIPEFEHQVKDYYISDWTQWNAYAMKYPAFNSKNPFAATSVLYALFPSFCSNYYGRPATIGVANYLSLKVILLNNTKDNVINAPFRYHIESPLQYWIDIKNANAWDDTQLKAFENELLSEMDNFLKANDGANAMKRFHTKFIESDNSREKLGWKITKIEDDTDKRVKSNFEVFEKINEHIIAASAIDPAISNIQIQGKLSSGLDKLTAFNIHMLINTPIPRKKILSAINAAIKVNFWKNEYRPQLGFRELQLSTVSKSKNQENTEDDNQNI